MARPVRVEFEGAVWHVTARRNERRTIFRNDQDRERFVVAVTMMMERFSVRVHAHCLSACFEIPICVAAFVPNAAPPRPRPTALHRSAATTILKRTLMPNQIICFRALQGAGGGGRRVRAVVGGVCALESGTPTTSGRGHRAVMGGGIGGTNRRNVRAAASGGRDTRGRGSDGKAATCQADDLQVAKLAPNAPNGPR
jgi:hypothetical protein